MPTFRALFLMSRIGALKPGIIYREDSLLIIMPGFRAPFLICRIGALKPGIIYREDSLLIIMPAFRALFFDLQNWSPKSWHNI